MGLGVHNCLGGRVESPHPAVSSGFSVSVVVRAKDKQATIERTLRALRSQTVPAQIIVVDSGSTDRTVEIARSFDAEVIEIPAAAFSYGRALNIGAQQATGDIVFALSAHSAPQTDRWIEWALEAYHDPDVAMTLGHTVGPTGTPVTTATHVYATDLDLDHNVTWGMSNHASSWRRGVWERFPFDEDLGASEDKEFMWRVLGAGYAIVVDPRLLVDMQHRWAEGAKALYRRTFKEYAALAELVDFDPPSLRVIVQKWWTKLYANSRPKWQRRLSPKRNAELAGEFLGSRAGSRKRGAHTLSRATWIQQPAAASSDRPK